MLGHKQNGRFPVAGFFSLDEKTVKITYPEDWSQLDFKSLIVFFNDYLELPKYQMFEKYSENSLQKITKIFDEILQKDVVFLENCSDKLIG